MTDPLNEIRYVQDLRQDLSDAELRSSAASVRSRLTAFGVPVAVVAAVAVILIVLTLVSPSHNRSAHPETGNSRPPVGGAGPVGSGEFGGVLGPEMTAMSATGPDDIWAVGYRDQIASPHNAVVLHYDGRSWQSVKVPGIYHPLGIAAVSATDVWVIGGNRLVLHWDGQRWSHVRLPKARGVQLRAVSGSDPSNVWIVGSQDGVRLPANSVGLHTLAYRFNGTSWSITKTPNPDYRYDGISGVLALSPTDTWATASGGQLGFTLHWTGSRWHRVAVTPPAGHANVTLTSLGTAGSQIWAVGDTGGNGQGTAVYMRWTGSAWQLVPAQQNDEIPQPSDISGSSPTDIWAAGNGNCCGEPVLTHSDGNRFVYRQVPQPPGAQVQELGGIVAFAPDDVWTIGVARDKTPRVSGKPIDRALIEHWNGTTWAPVAVQGLRSIRP